MGLDPSLRLIDVPKVDGFDDGHPEWGNTGNKELTKCARLWPHKIRGEGHFVALIKRRLILICAIVMPPVSMLLSLTEWTR